MAQQRKTQQRKQRAAGKSARPHALGITWEADVAPVSARLDDDPTARPAVVLVTAGVLPIHADLLAHPPSDAPEVARTIEAAVRTGAEVAGSMPFSLLVRGEEVARLLAGAETLRGVAVHAASDLPVIGALLREMAESLLGPGAASHISSPETWAGWALPDESASELFAAAAGFYRAAPWRALTNVQLLDAITPGGRSWTVCVLGNGGQEFGVALYEHRDDFGAFLEAEDPSEPFAAASGVIISLTFERATNLPKRMRREIEARGWEVAGRWAYPVLVTVNTLGGGITPEQVADLTAVLRTVPAFVERHRDVLAGETAAALPIAWTDDSSGTRIRYDGYELPTTDTVWGAHDVLEPSLATGAGAEPAASLVPLAMDAADAADIENVEAREAAVVERFQRAPRTERGRKGAPSRQRQGEDARLFVEFLTGYEGVPVRAVSEYDLRVFLYDWFPRKVQAPLRVARAVHAALAPFFAFLAEHENIVCEWADGVLDERQIFEQRVKDFPGGFWWDAGVQEWQSELWADLDARIMIPHPDLGEGEHWGEMLGLTEHSLQHAMQRQWLVWRDEVIRAGTTAPEAVRAALIPREHAWVRAPLDVLGGRTPLAAIHAERRKGR